MLIGLGHLGGPILDRLILEPSISRIVACARDPARGEARCNLARLIGAVHGRTPRVEFQPLDLARPEAVAEVVRTSRPDLILTAAAMQTWWLVDLLPAEPAAALRRAGFGLWLPLHLAPTLKLMEALREAGYPGPTLGAPYPDVVHPILARRGLAPTCGVGNVDEMAIKVELAAARHLGVRADEVEVELVAHHSLEPAVFGGFDGPLPPHSLHVTARGGDVTAEVGADRLLLSASPLPAGPSWGAFTAASAVRLIRALLADGERRLHAPGPNGLPGGYPILAGKRLVRPAPLAAITQEEAIALNRRAHSYDGIDRIESDGTAVLTDAAAEAARHLLGYDCPRLAPSDAEARGHELIARLDQLGRRHGLDLASWRAM